MWLCLPPRNCTLTSGGKGEFYDVCILHKTKLRGGLRLFLKFSLAEILANCFGGCWRGRERGKQR